MGGLMENKLKINAGNKIDYVSNKLRDFNIVAEQIMLEMDKNHINEYVVDSLNQNLEDCMDNIKAYETLLATLKKYYEIASRYPDEMEVEEIRKISETNPEVLICYYGDKVFFNNDIAFIMNESVDEDKFSL